MKLMQLQIDPLILAAIDRKAVQRGQKRVHFLRDLYYSFVASETRGMPFRLIEAPSYPKAIPNPDRVRVRGKKLITVDANGLADDLE